MNAIEARAAGRFGIRYLAVVATAIIGGAGCHLSAPTCSSFSIVPPIITVTDARTGAAICDANVVVVEPPDASFGIPPDSSYWQLNAGTTLPDGDTVLADGGSTACTYAGGPFADMSMSEAPLTLVVSKPGYRTATATAVTKGYGCDDPNPPPAPDRVNVMLEPDPVPNDAGSE